jgi:hypothetical protein
MLPTQNLAVVALGISRLTSANKRLLAPGVYARPNLVALLSASLAEFQLLENVFWQIIEAQWLANAAAVPGSLNVALDKLGALVGQSRTGLNNSLYGAIIALRILANRSHGRAEDIIQLAAAMAYISANGILPPGQVIAPPGSVAYVEGYPAGFIVEVYGLLSVLGSLNIFQTAKPLGVAGVLHYSTTPASQVMKWSYDDAGDGGNLGWAYQATGANAPPGWIDPTTGHAGSPAGTGVGGLWVASEVL